MRSVASAFVPRVDARGGGGGAGFYLGHHRFCHISKTS